LERSTAPDIRSLKRPSPGSPQLGSPDRPVGDQLDEPVWRRPVGEVKLAIATRPSTSLVPSA
jgi:hypothetical protein